MIEIEILCHFHPFAWCQCLKWVPHHLVVLIRKMYESATKLIDHINPTTMASSRFCYFAITDSPSLTWRRGLNKEGGPTFGSGLIEQGQRGSHGIKLLPQDADLDRSPSVRMRHRHCLAVLLRPSPCLPTEVRDCVSVVHTAIIALVLSFWPRQLELQLGGRWWARLQYPSCLTRRHRSLRPLRDC